MNETDWKNHKGVVTALVLLALAVWGYNGYLLVGSSVEEEVVVAAPRETAQRPSSGASDRRSFRYTGDFRDPFVPGSRQEAFEVRAPSSPSAPPEAVPPPSPPPLILRGIVDGTAIIEAPSGEVYLAKAGASIEDVEILAVGDGGVELRFDRVKYELVLAQ